ncbi:hypothetical protein JOQ06_003349 [Pogonophryne albipinna]|uniref:RabBD domain-containing protein n=1 Tax=Pogonophryne albipinna TaxID=1090488 RepID=A0AAD6AB49_9TELE|nr:hypothetical protein JOQ06_003349 [Pogonophryne albipinna]
MDQKLDLSRLSDDEAKHVWEVIQRDFNLRKKEEERLGDLKTLQVFTCKSCSRYNRKERGWVCDNCRMTRVLKVGTAGWYHDNVRNRFKRFGSAKVMRSLYKRLNGEGGRDDDTMSMPDVHSHAYNGEDDHGESEVQRYKVMRKNKRLLSVHPLDFDPEDYYPYARRPSVQQQLQEERGFRNDDYFDTNNMRGNRRKSLYNMRAEEESRMVRTRSLSRISSSAARQYVDTSDEEESYPPPYLQPPPLYHQPPPHRRRNSRASSQENLGQAPPAMNELNKRMSAIESLLNRLEGKIPPADQGGPGEEEKLRRKLSELGGPSSDEEPLRKPAGRPPAGRPPAVRGGRDKEMSSSSDETPTQAQKRSSAAALCDLTAEVLRTINATENAAQEYDLQPQSPPAGRPPTGRPDAKQADEAFRELEENVYLAAGSSFSLEQKLSHLERGAQSRFGATDSDLSELEDEVARTAQRVQSADSEVSDIESKLAALSTSGSLDPARGGEASRTRGGEASRTRGGEASRTPHSGAPWRPNV